MDLRKILPKLFLHNSEDIFSSIGNLTSIVQYEKMIWIMKNQLLITHLSISDWWYIYQ